MIVSWMVYSTVTSLLLGGVAVAIEHCLRIHDKPARWVWMVAFASSLSWPLIAFAVPDVLPSLQTTSQPSVGNVELAETVWTFPNRMIASAENQLITFETAILILWATASFLLLSVLALSFSKLRREVRYCTSSRVNGIPVLVSTTLGPAVVGMIRQRIVLPEWVLECDARMQTMIVEHELEHVRARDRYILAVAYCF